VFIYSDRELSHHVGNIFQPRDKSAAESIQILRAITPEQNRQQIIHGVPWEFNFLYAGKNSFSAAVMSTWFAAACPDGNLG